MSRVLVTGGAGFIGGTFVPRMVASAHSVVVLDDFTRGRRQSLPSDVIVVEGDVRDQDVVDHTLTVHRPEVVVHLAALHFIPDCDRDPDATWAINVEATAALGELAARRGVARVVFASTGAVYTPSDSPHDEHAPLGPIDIYGRSKVAAENVLATVLDGTRLTIARLFNVFGPGETNPHLIPEVVAQAQAGDTVRLGRTDTVRDYVFVGDVAAALEFLSTADVPPPVVNVGSGRGHDALDVVGAVADVVGRSIEVEFDERRVRPVDRPVLVADTGTIRHAMDWHPTPLTDGIRAALSR